MFTPHHVSCVTCHVSPVTCHMSPVTCHFFSFFLFFYKKKTKIKKLKSFLKKNWTKGWSQSGKGSVINGTYPVQFFQVDRIKKKKIIIRITKFFFVGHLLNCTTSSKSFISVFYITVYCNVENNRYSLIIYLGHIKKVNRRF